MTLIAYDDLDTDETARLLRDHLAGIFSLPLHLNALGQFLEPTGTVYLAPVPTRALLTFRHELMLTLSRFGTHLFASYYEPDRWTPHVTLAGGLSSDGLSQAFQVCKQVQLPLCATVNRVGIIDFPAEIERAAIDLG